MAMIPLELRRNKLIAILIRSLTLEIDFYSLHIQFKDKTTQSISLTRKTIIPRFEIDQTENPLKEIVNKTSEGEVIITFKNSKEEAIEEFRVDLSELVFLSKELCNAKIYSYPIIIFEFTEGFYITKDIYLSQFNKQLLSSEKTDLKPLMSSKKKKEVSFFKYNEKVKEWEFFYKQNLNLRAEKQEALSRLNEKILQATKDCENINDRKILNAKIQDIKAQINETKIRCEDYRDAITLLRKIISDKESDLHIAKTIMNNNTYYSEFAQKKKENKNEENCDFVETLGEPAKEEIQSSRSNVQTTENEYFQGNDEKENCNEDSTLSKNPNTPMNTIPSNPSNNEISQEFEMAENFWSPIPKVTFITNNQIDENSKEDSNHQYYSEYAKTFKGYNPVIKAKLDKLTKKVDKYKIMLNTLRNKKIAEIAFFFFNSTCSKFYIVPAINQDDKNALFKFYDKHSRELSVMTGVIAQLLAYMSSLFNVTLTYPMLVNGSKSFMVKNKKDFIPLDYSRKLDYGLNHFMIALSALHVNLVDIMKFLRCYNTKSSGSFFKDFIKLYEYCMDVVLTNNFIDDLIST